MANPKAEYNVYLSLTVKVVNEREDLNLALIQNAQVRFTRCYYSCYLYSLKICTYSKIDATQRAGYAIR